MPNTKNNPDPTCERFIAFLDILGFTERVLRDTPEKIHDMMKSFSLPIKVLRNEYKKKRVFSNSIIRPVMFSDSVLLISRDNTFVSAKNLIIAVQMVLTNALLSGIPIKGAIAFGSFTADFPKSIYFGKPLIDAYRLQDELELYGVILHHTAESRFKEKNYINKLENGFIYEFPTPLEKGKVKHYLVDWDVFEGEFDAEEPIRAMCCDISGVTRRYIYNTLEYIKSLENERNKNTNKVIIPNTKG